MTTTALVAGPDGGLDVVRIEVEPILSFDVAEDGGRADVPDRVGGSHEVERGNEHLVTRTAPDREQGEMQCRRSVRDGERSLYSAEGSELLLEGGDPGPMLHHPERTTSATASSISASTRTSESGTAQTGSLVSAGWGRSASCDGVGCA